MKSINVLGQEVPVKSLPKDVQRKLRIARAKKAMFWPKVAGVALLVDLALRAVL